MGKKVLGTLLTVFLILILLTRSTYSETTTRGALKIENDGTTQKIEDSSISVAQTIQKVSDKSITFKVEVENLQNQGTEVALVLDNSFSMWSQNKIENYKQKMIDAVNKIYEKIPDAYMSLSGYEGTIQAMTGNKDEIIEAINNVTEYTGINARTGLNYAKESFTGKAKNKHILVFTDTEETTEASEAISQIQADTSLYMTAVIMGENATKQTEYKNSIRTKVYQIEDITTYDFATLNTNIANWVYSSVSKEINNVVIEGLFTDGAKDIFSVQVRTQPNLGQLVLSEDGYKLTIPQMTNQKATFYLTMNLKDEIDRTYIGSIINIINSTTIKYDDKRQETKNLSDTTTTPSVSLVEYYTLEITAINKEFQEIKVDEVVCTIVQKDKDGNIVDTFENKKTDTNGKITIDNLIYTGESTLEISFISTPGPYEDKENETIKINKDQITGAITITDSTLLQQDGESIEVENSEKVISAKVAIPPKAIVFNIHKTDEETGLPLQNAKYKLTQPQTDDIPANSVITGTTNELGNTSLSGEVAGVRQSITDAYGDSKIYYYTYVIQEEVVPTGYIEQNTTTVVKIHFSLEGEIAGAYIDSNSPNAELTIENDKINLDLTNKMKYYTLNINAIDKENNTIPVAGAEFTVTGVNESGVQVCNKQGVTDRNGNLPIEINSFGKVTYTITQSKEHAAYENASNIQYILTRDFETNELTLHSAVEGLSLDNDKKVLTATVPLTPKKFTFKVNKKDLDENKPVEGVELQLIQPDNRDTLTQTTASDGIINYTGNVVCDAEGGKSKYYLKETQKAVGYKQINETIQVDVTFDEHGNIAQVDENSEFIENVNKENKKLEVDLLNEQQEYTIEVYAKHKNYNEIPIQGANFEITGNTVEDGTQFYQSENLPTDVTGKATSGIIKRSGDLSYTIHTNNVPKGYKLPESKTIKVNKNLQTENLTLLENNNENVKVSIDNTNKIIKVTMLIEPETFALQINKKDIGLSDTLIGNAKFDAKQPDITYTDETGAEKTKERNHIIETTQNDNALELQMENPVIEGTTERTFSYVLKEIDVPDGYVDTNFILNFDLTFNDDGTLQSMSNITETSDAITKEAPTNSKDDITVEEDNYLKLNEVQSDRVILTIANKQKGATLNVQALNKKYAKLGIGAEGVTIQVVARDSTGNEFYRNNLITDENGIIQVKGISQTGDFSIELTAIKGTAGYLPGSTKTIYLNRDILTTEITLSQNDSDTKVYNDSDKIIDTKMYIDVQTFNFDITKLEKLYGDTLIEGATFTIEQPNIKNNLREKVRGTSVKDSILTISPEVAGQGTFEYKIIESSQKGYINKGINTTLQITFDEDGNIEKVEKGTDADTVANDSIVTLGTNTDNTIPLTIMNEQMPYKIKVTAVDAKYGGVPVEGLTLKITGTTTSGEVYSSEKTSNASGVIESDDLTQRGDVDYTIEQINVPTGYEKGTDQILKINKDWDTTQITLREDIANVSIDNTSKIINITLYIEPQTFEINLNKVDKLDDNIKVAKAEFTLIQPDFETGQRRNSYVKTTTSESSLVFTGEVAGEGTYTYTLEETKVPSGYLALAKTTKLLITFNANGVIENVEQETDNEFVKIGNLDEENVVPVQIANEKKVHSLKITAMNEEYHDAKAEGVHIKLIRKDTNGNQVAIGTDSDGNPIMERTGETGENGVITFNDLEGTGDIIYEIIQEEPRPAAFYLGDSKTIQVHIDDATNNITNMTNDSITTVNNNIRQIDTEVYLTPKKFTITLNKIDYDNRNLIGGATIIYKEAKWERTLISETVDDEKYVITGYVPGEGDFEYRLDEGYYYLGQPGGRGIPDGYKNYLNTHKINIKFDSNGDIQDTNIIESEWFKVFWNNKDHVNYKSAYTDLKHHEINVLDKNTENIELELTNVKKQFAFNINAINSKYTNEKIANVHFRVIAYDESGNSIYNQVKETDASGQISIADQDYFRVTGRITFTIECLDTPSMFKDIPIATVVINRAEHPEQTITVDQVNTSSHVKVKANEITDPYNTSDFTYNVDVDIPLIQKTFDMDITKVSSSSENALLKGATFTLLQPDGKHTQTGTTDENGKLTFSADLYGGDTEYEYILTENDAPSGYQALDSQIKINVTAEDEEIQDIRITEGNSFINSATVANSKKASLTVKNIPEAGELYNVKVIEKYGSTKVEGSKYNIKINATSGEDLNVTDYTDSNGTIEVNKIPGNGEIIIKVNELENAPGYQLIQGEKIAVVDRSSGAMRVVSSKTSSDIDVSIDESTNTIIIELTTEPTIIVNKIEFEVVDQNDNEIRIGGTALNILPPNATEVINITTNENGYASIDSPDVPGEGEFEYSTVVTGVPSTYYEFLDNIKTGITYENGIIKNIRKIDETETNDNVEVEYGVENTSNTTTYKAKVKVKLESKTNYKLKVVANEKDNADKKIEGAKFDIKSVVNNSNPTTTTKVTNKDGEFTTIQASGDSVTIYLKQTETADPYVLDDSTKKLVLNKDSSGTFEIDTAESTDGLNATILDDGTIEVIIENELKGANINFQLLKLDGDNEAIRLEGVKLKLTDKSTNKEYELITDESGQVLLEGFKVTKPGEYDFVLSEISTIEGYDLPELADGEEIKFKIVYQELDGALQIKDVIQEGGEDVVTGMSYTQTSTETEYILQLKLIIENTIDENYKYKVNIYKRDQDTLDLLSGAQIKFKNTYAGNNAVNTIVETQTAGMASFTIPLVPNDNTIEIQEIVAPLGYKLDDTTRTIILNKDESTGTVTIVNTNNISSGNINVTDKSIDIYIDNESEADKAPSYQLELIKVDKFDETKKLEGVKFNIAGKERTTNNEGITSVTMPVPTDKTKEYTIIEEAAPADYLTNVGDIKLQIDFNDDKTIANANITQGTEFARIDNTAGSKITIIVTNEPIKKYSMELKKVDLLDTGNILEGAEYNIKIETEDGYTYEENITTLKDLSNKLEELQGYGDIKVTLTETEAPDGYKISEPIVIHFNRDVTTKEITKVSQSSDMVDIQIEDSNIYITLKDLPKGSYFTIQKVDKNDETIVLPNVEFSINGIDSVTNSEGKIQGYSKVNNGETSKTYTIIENKTVDGYELNPDVQLKVDYDTNGDVTFAEITQGKEFARVVSYDKNSVNVIITNEKIEYYGVEIEKQDKTDNSIKIQDTKFKVEITNNGTTESQEIITNAYGIANILNLTGYGDIQIKITELENPSKYTLDTEEKIITLTRDRITKEIKITGQTGKNIDVQLDDANKLIKIIFLNEPIVLGADIIKVDADDNNILLENVKFDVKISGYTTQITTNDTGTASINIKGLEKNTPYELEITEIETVSGYKLNSQPIKITVEIDESGKIVTANMTGENEWVIGSIENNRIKLIIKNEKLPEDEYTLQIEKQSNLSEDIKLANAKYKVQFLQEDSIVKTEDLVTNTLGIAQIYNLKFDKITTIKLKEEEAPDGYYLDETEKEFKVELDTEGELKLSDVNGNNIKVSIDKENKAIKVILIDEAKEINFEIEKVDKDDESIKLANVGFKVEGKDGVTNAEGILISSVGDALVNTKKIYTIEETNISSEYVKLDTPTQIEVEYGEQGEIKNVQVLNNNEYVEFIGLKDGMIQLRFKNEKIKEEEKEEPYKILFVKKDKNDQEKLLPGAKYKIDIESSDGFKKATEITTNEAGVALLNDVNGYGNITIGLEEKEAPSNYKIDSDKKTVKVTRDKTIKQLELSSAEGNNVEAQVDNENNAVIITLYDEQLTFNLDIIKVDKQDQNIRLAGVEFEFAGNTFTTDENGEIHSTINVPEASKEYELEIKETKTIEGYDLIESIILAIKIDDNGNVESYSVKDGEDNVKVTLEAGKIKLIVLNEKKQQEEEKKEYNIFIQKADSKDLNKKLANAKFRALLDKDRNQILDKEIITNENGDISLGKITQDGTYTLRLKELSAPEGYIINSNDSLIVFTAKDGVLNVDKELSSEEVITDVTDNTLNIILKNELKDVKLHIEKFVTKVNGNTIENTIPEVSITDGKIIYDKKDTSPVHTKQNDIVVYTLRIYNEGNIDTYAKHIVDTIPEGLEFLPEHEINKKYQWKKLDEGTIETNILSKNNIIEKPSENVHYKEIQVAFKVTKLRDDNEITNIAMVDKATDEYGEDKEISEKDEAKIKIDYFDLSVQKEVNNIIVKKDGVVTKTIKGAGSNGITKSEIRSKEFYSTTLQVEYKIIVYNEGNVKGNLIQVIDYIPEGMSFDKNSNPDWEVKNNVILYTKQEEIPVGQTKEITIKLDWNSNLSTGLKENVVEIKGENEIDYTNNKDTAKALIMVATGAEKVIIILPMVVLGIFGLGIYAIKRYVL